MPTLREQYNQFKQEGTTAQAKDRVRELLGVQDLKVVAPFLDYDVKDISSTLSLVPGFGKQAPEQPVTPAKEPDVVAPTPEPEEPVAGLPAPVTPSPEVEPSPLSPDPKLPERVNLIDYQGTVRVPFLDELRIGKYGLISPYKGKDVTLELGPSVEKLGAAAAGAVTGATPYVATFLEAMASPFTKPLTEKEEDPVRERARQKKLKRVLEVAKKFDEAKGETAERNKDSFLLNAADDTKEVLFGLATMFNELVGITARTQNISRAQAGYEFGKQMGEGLPLITGQVFGAGENDGGIGSLARSFQSRPLTTVLTLLPIVQAVKGVPGLRGPAVEAESALGRMWNKSKQPIPFEVVTEQVGKLPGAQKLKRFLEEPATMKTPEQTRIAERAIEEPRIVAGKTQAQTARLGREIAREAPTEQRPVSLTPDETMVLEQQQAVLEQLKEGSNINIPDGEGVVTVKDLGQGEAFVAASEVLGVQGNSINTLFQRATQFYDRLGVRNIQNKGGVMKAALIELLLEEGGNVDLINQRLSRNEMPRLLNAMVRSLERQRQARVAGNTILDLTTPTDRAMPVVTEVFEVGGEGVVRQPTARGSLTEAEVRAAEFGRQVNYEMAFEGKVTPKERNIARKELAEMPERVVETPQTRPDTVPTTPSIERVVDYVHKQIRKLYEERQALLPDVGLAIEQSPYSRRALRRRLTQALDQETVAFLREPKVARRVRKDLVRAAKEAGVPFRARRRMLKSFNEFIADTAAQTSQVVFPEFKYNGQTFYGRQNILNVFDKLPEKVKTYAIETTTTRIGYEIAAELETIKQVGALNGELNRFVTEQNVASPDIYAVQMATEVIGNGQARPLIMPHNGEQVAASLRSRAEMLGNAISEKSGISKELATQQVLDLAKYVSGFEPMARTVGVIERGGIRGLTYPEKLAASYADPAFNNSVFWDVAAKNGFFENSTVRLITDIGNMFKRNVVARSVPALVNNNISNVLAVSGRRGVTPPQVMLSLGRFNNRFAKYLKGEKPVGGTRSEMLRYELIEAMDTEGIFSSNDVRQDFVTQVRKGAAPTDIPVEQVKAGIDYVNQQVFERWYTRYGDDLFKGEFAYQRGDRALKQLEKTKPGFETRFENNPTSHWRVEKTGPDTFKGELFNNKTGKSMGNAFTADLNNPAQRTKLMKAVARDGLYHGNELFFDYGRVGNWTKMLRALPITNLTSSFHTWFFKALDIPFLKKGLVYKTLLQTDSIPSTDPAIMAANSRADAALAARRALIANSMTGANSQRQERKDLRTPLSFSPSRQELAFVVATTHPDYVLQYALGSRDYTDPTVMGLKAIQKLFLNFRDDEARMKELFPPRSKLDKMSDKEWANLQKQRKYFMKTMDGTVLSPKEALELAGIGGSIALNMYDYIRETEKQGKVIDLPGVFRNFGKVLLGSTTARLLDIAVAGAVEGGVAPDFLQKYTRLGKQEMRRGYRSGQVNPNQSNFIQYAVKEAFGIGWNSIMYIGDIDEATGRPTTGAMKRYVSNIGAELRANMLKPKQDEARRMRAKADQATDPKQKEYFFAEYERLILEAEQIEDTIKDQQDLYLDKFEDALNKVYYDSLGTPKPPK